MTKTFDVFVKDLASLRTGRANASMLDLIKVDVYGQKMPINQLATITTPEPRVINIQVWDANNVPLLDSAIKKSDLGLNPQIDGQLVRLPIPDLSEERRVEIKKVIKTMGEKCKVSIRNIRREANDDLKKLLKSKEISEDDEKSNEKKVQTITDNHIKQIDDKYSNILLVGHNPAYTEISNYFSENKILNLPTARWFCLKFDTDSWSEIIGLKPTYYINNINSES